MTTDSAPVLEEAVGRLTEVVHLIHVGVGGEIIIGWKDANQTSDDLQLVLSTLAAQSVLLRDIGLGLMPFATVASAMLGRPDRAVYGATTADGVIATVVVSDFRAAAALLARINALHPEKETDL